MKMIPWSAGLALLAMVFASGCCCPGRCYNSCYDPCGSMGACAPACNSCGTCNGGGGCEMCGSSTAWDDTCDWTMDCIDGTCGSVGNKCGKLKCKIKSGCKSFWSAIAGPCNCDQCNASDDSFEWLTQSGCDCARCKKKKCKGGCEYSDSMPTEPMSPPKCQSCQARHAHKMNDPTGYAHIGPGMDESEAYAMDGSVVSPLMQGPMLDPNASVQGAYPPGAYPPGAYPQGPYAQGPIYPPGPEYFQGPATPMLMAPPQQVTEQLAPSEGPPQAAVIQGPAPVHYPPNSAYPRSMTRWRPAENVPAPPVEEEAQLVPSAPIAGPAVTQPVQGEEAEEFERPLILQQNYEGAPGYGIVPAGR